MNQTNEHMFFTNSNNQDLIKQVSGGLDFLETTESNDNSRIFVIKSLKEILKSMESNAEYYDEMCQSNIQWVGNNFIGSIRSYLSEKDKKFEKIGPIFTMALRFICELEFSMPGEMHFELRQIKNGVEEHLNLFSDNEKSQIIYALYTMPVSIAKRIMHHENIESIKSFNKIVSEADSKKAQWEKDLKDKEQEVKEISDKLEKYKNAFNFVGLYDGFNQLSEEKKKEKFWLFLSLLFVSFLVLSPLVSEVLYIILNQDTISKYKDILIYAALPLVTVEIILIYFFRIILFNYKSVKALLVQIELRKTLCQFIQNYSEYSKKIKSEDSSALEKFENLIFSGLITNEENLPSTFDGVEQLTKLIKSAKP
ncbi:MAG: hypothetical protein ABFS09_00650 [Thermodesulfobacteriota bacterium]